MANTMTKFFGIGALVAAGIVFTRVIGQGQKGPPAGRLVKSLFDMEGARIDPPMSVAGRQAVRVIPADGTYSGAALKLNYSLIRGKTIVMKVVALVPRSNPTDEAQMRFWFDGGAGVYSGAGYMPRGDTWQEYRWVITLSDDPRWSDAWLVISPRYSRGSQENVVYIHDISVEIPIVIGGLTPRSHARGRVGTRR